MRSNGYLTANKDTLLPRDKDFVIRGAGTPYRPIANITYRSPQDPGDALPFVIATSTLRADQLRGLRCEQIEGHFYVINDTDNSLDREVRFRVVNEQVGNIIIQAVLEFADPDLAAKKNTEAAGVPALAQKLNRVCVACGPLITAGCGISISFSALIWILFK